MEEAFDAPYISRNRRILAKMGSPTKIFNINFSIEELVSYQNFIFYGHTFRHNVF